MSQFHFLLRISPSSPDVLSSLVYAPPWCRGYKINVIECQRLGMEARWLRLLSEGIDLMLDTLPPFDIRRENYSTASENLAESTRLINDQLLLGILEEDVCSVRVHHPLGLVEKKLEPGQVGPPKLRLITDARATGLNDCIRDCPFPLPSIHDVIVGAKKGWWAAKFDLKDGFYHLPIHKKFVDLLGIRHPSTKRTARYRFLCFGLKCAPFFFQGTMCELRRMLYASGLIDCVSFVYIDDWLLLAPTREILVNNMLAFENAMIRMGICLHPTKRDGPVQCIEYIGLVLDLVHARLTISLQRCYRLRQHVVSLLDSVKQGTWAVTVMDTVIGKLMHVANIVVGGRAALSPLYEARRRASLSWKHPNGKPPTGALISVSRMSDTQQVKTRVDETLRHACARGLEFWLRHLSTEAPPARQLFVYEDGSLWLWGTNVSH